MLIILRVIAFNICEQILELKYFKNKLFSCEMTVLVHLKSILCASKPSLQYKICIATEGNLTAAPNGE